MATAARRRATGRRCGSTGRPRRRSCWASGRSAASPTTRGTPTSGSPRWTRCGVDRQVLSPTPVFFAYDQPADAAAGTAADLQRPRARDRRAGARTGSSRSARCRCRTPTPPAASSTGPWPPGHRGVEIGNHVGDRDLDDAGVVTFLQHCAARDVPVFVHPWDMPDTPRTRRWMAQWLTGMPAETHLSILAMILGGVFDQVDAALADLLRARRRLVRVLARAGRERLARPPRRRRHLGPAAARVRRPVQRRLRRVRRGRAAAARRHARRRPRAAGQRLPVPARRSGGGHADPHVTARSPTTNAPGCWPRTRRRYLGAGVRRRDRHRRRPLRGRRPLPRRHRPGARPTRATSSCRPAPGGRFPEAAYLAGNSLGLQPRTVRAILDEELAGVGRAGRRGARRGRAAVEALPRVPARAAGPAGRRAARRDRRDELAHGQPAPADDQLLPADACPARDRHRRQRVPLRLLRRAQPGRAARLRPRRGGDPAAAPRGRGHAAHRGRAPRRWTTGSRWSCSAA